MKHLILLLTMGLAPHSFAYSNMGQAPKQDTKQAENMTEGEVQEIINSGGYTYLRLKLADSKEVWAAGTFTDASKGDKIKFSMSNPMNNFESKSLGRTFETIYFVMDFKSDQTTKTKSSYAKPHGQAPAQTDLKIEKLKDGQTVEEVYLAKEKWNSKKAKIKGKVVKYSSGILGKNWIHLQDGTGGQGTNDLVVTTNQEAAVNDVIVVEGAIVLNKDIGSGYVYDVMMENATITK